MKQEVLECQTGLPEKNFMKKKKNLDPLDKCTKFTVFQFSLFHFSGRGGRPRGGFSAGDDYQKTQRFR